jgi:hypothetical protein
MKRIGKSAMNFRVVNFTNLFYEHIILYKRILISFDLLTVSVCKFWRRKISAKSDQKMLLKLTTAKETSFR